MTKVRNQKIYSDDLEYLKRLADEVEFIGRDYRLDLKAGVLTVFVLPPHRNKHKPKKHEPRNKHAESAGRRA